MINMTDDETQQLICNIDPIEQTIKELEELGGFERQIALLSSKTGRPYFRALTQTQWVIEVGEKTESVFILAGGVPERDRRRAEGRLDDYFQHREHDTEPLRLLNETLICPESVNHAFEGLDKIIRLGMTAQAKIFQYVKETFGNNQDTLYEIFKAETPSSNSPRYDDENARREQFISKLESRYAHLAKSVEDKNLRLETLLELGVELLGELVPSYKIDPDKDHLSNAKSLLPEGKRLLVGDLDAAFQAYEDARKEGLFDRTIASAHETIKRSSELDANVLQAALENMTPFFFDKGGVSVYVTAIEDKKANLSDYYQMVRFEDKEIDDIIETLDSCLHDQHVTLIGIQQIIEGGPITRPHEGRTSKSQNKARFPNISYPSELVTELASIAGEMQQLLDDFPDVSRITEWSLNSSRRACDITEYVIEELPKDPLDVTFGDDAGSKISVSGIPEEQSVEGLCIPHYLLDDAVRMFAIYDQTTDSDPQKRKRIGLIMAFETQAEGSSPDSDEKYLSCNSIEISVNNMIEEKKSGSPAKRSLVEYAEEWLIGYAQKHGYHGVTMGIAEDNPVVPDSKPLSIYSGQFFSCPVEEVLEHTGEYLFYSDIFELRKDESGKRLVSPPGTNYWLWRRQDPSDARTERIKK
jgi:hypothetical protein